LAFCWVGLAWVGFGLGQLWAGSAFVELAFCQVGFGFWLGWICFLVSWLFAGLGFG